MMTPVTSAKISESAARSALAVASPGRHIGRIAAQSALLAGVWYVADFLTRAAHLPVPGGVVGLVLLLALLFCGGVAPRWVKAGADWLLSDMLLFFIPAAVAAVKYGGLFRADGWRLALVVVAGTAFVMVAVAVAVDLAAKFERRLAAQRVRAGRRRVRP